MNRKIEKLSENVYFFKTNQKTVKISKVIVVENKTKFDALNVSIILDALVDRVKKYDKHEFKINKALNYDFIFHTSFKEIDNNLLVNLEVVFIDLKFLEEEQISNIKQFIFDIFDGLFIEESNLALRIKDYEKYLTNIANNPTNLSKMLIGDLIYRNDALWLKYEDKIDYLKKVRVEDLMKVYKSLEESDNYYYFIEGDEYSTDLLSEDLNKEQKPLKVFDDVKRTISFEEETFSNITKDNQVSMIITYQMEGMEKEDEYTLKILNLILGGNSSSKLFRNVREKENICYSIHSIDKMYYGIDVVIEVDKNNLEIAQRRIDEEFEEIKYGNIDEFDMCKDKYIISLEQNSTKGYLQKILLDKNIIKKTNAYDYNNVLEEIQKVSKEDIIELARKMKRVKKLEIT